MKLNLDTTRGRWTCHAVVLWEWSPNAESIGTNFSSQMNYYPNIRGLEITSKNSIYPLKITQRLSLNYNTTILLNMFSKSGSGHLFFPDLIQFKTHQNPICQPQSVFFPLIKVIPQFLIMGIFTLKLKILRINKI